jgi:hypothetical protein
MSIQELIELVRRKLISLNGARSHAYLVGDVEALVDLDAKIETTQASLDQLLTLV